MKCESGTPGPWFPEGFAAGIPVSERDVGLSGVRSGDGGSAHRNIPCTVVCFACQDVCVALCWFVGLDVLGEAPLAEEPPSGAAGISCSDAFWKFVFPTTSFLVFPSSFPADRVGCSGLVFTCELTTGGLQSLSPLLGSKEWVGCNTSPSLV